MKDIELDIRREGREWDADEALIRIREFPARAEMIDGKFFWTEEERLTALGMLLENVGIDKAVRLGDPQLWKEAIAALEGK
jgi:hypothetical protein